MRLPKGKCWPVGAPAPCELAGPGPHGCARVCATRYRGPTDHRGSTIVVSRVAPWDRDRARDDLVVPWPYELGAADAHRWAAMCWLAADLAAHPDDVPAGLTLEPDWAAPTIDGWLFGWFWPSR